MLGCIVFGALYGLGVFKQNKILPIRYDDKNWVETNEGTMAIAFDKKLTATEDQIGLNLEINETGDHVEGNWVYLSKSESKTIPYTLYSSQYLFEEQGKQYMLTLNVYVDAKIVDGDIIEGKGFVVEVESFGELDATNQTLLPQEIDSLVIYDIVQDLQKNSLLK